MPNEVPEFTIRKRLKPIILGWVVVFIFLFLYNSGIRSVNDVLFRLTNQVYSVENSEGIESVIDLTLADGTKLSANVIEGTISNGVLVGNAVLRGSNGAVLNVNFDNGNLVEGAVEYEIKDYSITTNKLADQSVTNTKIVDGTITSGKLVEGIIVTNLLGNNVVTSVKIADGAITSSKLLDGVVVTSKLADGSITEIKLADGSVTTGRIANLAITGNKISSGTITGINIADGAIGEAKLEDGSITEIKILDGSITLSKLSSLMCLNGEILKKTLTGWECSVDVGTGSVTAGGGLSNSGTPSDPILDVNVDNLTIEVSGDALQVRAGGITSLEIANQTITNEDIAILANIEWSKINKTGSSIADLTTRAFSDLTGRLAQYVEIQDLGGYFVANDAEGAIQEIGGNFFRQDGNSFGTTATVGTNDNNPFRIETNGVERITVLANGNVGIGTTNPANSLVVESTLLNTWLQVRGNNSATNATAGLKLTTVGSDISWDIYNTRNSRSLTIGHSDPTGRDLTIANGNSGAVNMIILGSGNVGIGTTTPATKLDVNGALYIGANVDTSAQGELLRFRIGSSGGATGYLSFQRSGGVSSSYQLGMNGANQTFGFRQVGDSSDFIAFNSSNTVHSDKFITFGAPNGVVDTSLAIYNSGTGGGQETLPLVLANNQTNVNSNTGIAFRSINNSGTEYSFAKIVGLKTSSWSTGTAIGGLGFYVTNGTGSFTEAARFSAEGNFILRTSSQIRPITDSTSAIQFANSTGINILNIDSTNSRILIGSTSPTITQSPSLYVFTQGSTSGFVPIIAEIDSSTPSGTRYIQKWFQSGIVRSQLTSTGVQEWNLYAGAETGRVTISTPGGLPGIIITNPSGTGRLDIAQQSVNGGLSIGTTTGSGNPGSQFVITTAGNVGIGTTNPTSMLDVAGTARFVQGTGSSSLFVTNHNNSGNSAVLQFNSPGGNIQYGGYGTLRINGGVANPSTNATVKLVVAGTTAQTANLQEWHNGSGGILSVVNASGHFGIGTSSTSYPLTVVGNTSFHPTGGSQLLIDGNAGNARIFSPSTIRYQSNAVSGIHHLFQNQIAASFNGTLVTMDTAFSSGGGVLSLIGPFHPTSGSNTFTAMSITSNVNQTGGANGITRGIYINPTLISVADWRSIDITSNSGYALYQSGSSALNYLAGKVGIGDSSPVSLFTVGNGDLFQVNSSGAIVAATGITSSGTITFSGLTNCSSGIQTDAGGVLSCLPSDQSLKNNVQKIDSALNIVSGLRGVTFNWRDNLYGTQREYGFIAQEVEQIAPELVFTMGTGLKGVKYSQITGLLVEAVKEQQSRIEDLDSRFIIGDLPETILTQQNITSFLASSMIPDLKVNNLNVSTELRTQTLKVLASSEFFGEVFFRNNINVAGDLKVDGQILGNVNTAGRVVLKAGATKIKVEFSKAYTKIPSVNITPVGSQLTQNSVNFYIDNQTLTSFEIVLTNQLPQDQIFNWISIGTDSQATINPVSYTQ